MDVVSLPEELGGTNEPKLFSSRNLPTLPMAELFNKEEEAENWREDYIVDEMNLMGPRRIS